LCGNQAMYILFTEAHILALKTMDHLEIRTELNLHFTVFL